MSIKLRHLTPFLVAGAAATAIAVAPTAQAAQGSSTCRDNGTASVCEKTGHASIFSSPQNSGPNQPMRGGSLSQAQMWALG